MSLLKEWQWPAGLNGSEEMKTMVALKAALWTDGDQAKLIEQAVRSYRNVISVADVAYCGECSNKTRETLAEYRSVNDVVFTGVPTVVCSQCGTKTWDLQLLAALDRIAEKLQAGSTITLEQALSVDAAEGLR